uniref:Uncharacterized protein n=1 Tax=Cucumis melo TaxID=3656 RepID=A0A9I9ED60_CUCME
MPLLWKKRRKKKRKIIRYISSAFITRIHHVSKQNGYGLKRIFHMRVTSAAGEGHRGGRGDASYGSIREGEKGRNENRSCLSRFSRDTNEAVAEAIEMTFEVIAAEATTFLFGLKEVYLMVFSIERIESDSSILIHAIENNLMPNSLLMEIEIGCNKFMLRKLVHVLANFASMHGEDGRNNDLDISTSPTQ